MMMEQCGYGIAMGGYTHVPEYIEGYPVSPYGGSVRERAEDAGPQGIYERRAIESGNGWDRTSNDSGRKTSNHHTSHHHTTISSNMEHDGPYIQQKQLSSAAPGREGERGGGGGGHEEDHEGGGIGGGGGGGGGGSGRVRGRGGRGHGSEAGDHGVSPDRPLLMAVDAAEGSDTFDLRPSHFTGGSHLQPMQPTTTTRATCSSNAVDDQFTFVDWHRNYAPCTPGQYYPLLHESKKYGDIGDFAERNNAHSAAYLPTQAELQYDCPPVAATYPAGLYPGSGQALPYCQPSPPGTTIMSDGWHGGSSSVASDDVQLSVEETEKRRNPYRAAAAAAAAAAAVAQTAEPGCSGSGHRSQVNNNRFPSTSSSSLASSSRRGSEGGAHPPVPHHRRQGGGGGSSHHHQRRWHSDLTETFLDEDERKLRERDRKKKDNHNLIERKRRLNINANIQVLGTLLPPSSSSVSLPKDSTQNKGNILRAAVDFVQSAQQQIERLQLAEHRLRNLHVANRQLRCRIEDYETFIRAAGLYEDYKKTVGDKGSPNFTHSSPTTFDAVKEEMSFSPTSLQRQESDVTDDCTGG